MSFFVFLACPARFSLKWMEKMNDNVKSYKEIPYMYVVIVLCNQATNVAPIDRVTTHGPLRIYILQVIFCF